MPFDEAVELARLIRVARGWHVLSIEPLSGEELAADLWAVQAVSDKSWRTFHYFRNAGEAERWPAFLASFERFPHGQTHEV